MKPLLFSLLLIIPFISLSQNTFEGTIVYAIEYLEVPEEVKGFESMLPSDMSMKFSGSKTRIEQQLMGGSQVVVTDNEAEDAFMLMDLMGQKIAVVMSKEELDAERETIQDPRIIYKDDTKEVMGYTCKLAYVHQPDSDQLTAIWYTNELNIKNHQDFEQLNGFPLEYESVKDNMKIRLTATSVKEEEIADYLFLIPAGFDEMTLDELKEFGQ